jgi:hypothetical protein
MPCIPQMSILSSLSWLYGDTYLDFDELLDSVNNDKMVMSL